jgi:uncharacterized protein (DUF58 family)
MLRGTARRDRMIGLFAIGLFVLNPPILNLVNGTIFGWPALYLYLFLVWALLIVAIAVISERRGDHPEERTGDDARQ